MGAVRWQGTVLDRKKCVVNTCIVELAVWRDPCIEQARGLQSGLETRASHGFERIVEIANKPQGRAWPIGTSIGAARVRRRRRRMEPFLEARVLSFKRFKRNGRRLQ